MIRAAIIALAVIVAGCKPQPITLARDEWTCTQSRTVMVDGGAYIGPGRQLVRRPPQWQEQCTQLTRIAQ